MPSTNPSVLVFAKAPQAGSVKTRLISRLGPEGAAALHAKLVERTMETAQQSAVGPVILYCAPDTADPFFASCARRYDAALRPQVSGDVGVRMETAFRETLSGARNALLVGTDCPALTPNHLRLARDALEQGEDAVFIPVEDGGYVSIGLARVDTSLFSGIPWSTAQVMEATRRQLRALHWRWRELDTLWDVDLPDDYERMVADAALLPGARQRRD